ncbi:MAG: hypothetical protein FWH14_00345 [Oscillospiraceae bacterium]|nr:hypothetical protein [Oscillospiraceae bacterium]
MKTIRRIADEIGVTKQRVYRYIKKHGIVEKCQKQGVMYFDDAVENLIKQAFLHKTVSNETQTEQVQNTLVSMLTTTGDS